VSRQPPIRIGARGSKLSLAQSGLMQARIAHALGVPVGASQAEIEAAAPLIPIVTTGDRIQDRRLMEIGGKGLFTKEIEEALLDGRIDCAVHSLKDMPAELPPGLILAATPEREDPRDAFISNICERLEDLPKGARLGTASLRRQAQALHVRPDLEIVMLRGNVDTRLAKLERGEADAILLAQSGLNRLGLGHITKSWLDPDAAPPPRARAPWSSRPAWKTPTHRGCRLSAVARRPSPSPPSVARSMPWKARAAPPSALALCWTARA
jgi:hydroxymethylbilane synthase